jgi:hypothetical protein
MKDNFQDDVHKAIYKELEEALKDFIQRLSLVKQVILDLGLTPEELQNLGPASWIQKNIPQTGIWKLDTWWQYFLHGKGCRLTNIVSGEILDWNSYNTSGIDVDPYAFIRYLKWRVDKQKHFENIKKYTRKSDLEALIPLVHQILQSISGTSNP